jgi:hypothetical protein
MRLIHRFWTIAYFPSERPLEVIDSLLSPFTPATGPIIDRIIREWAVHGLRSDHEAAIDRFWDDGSSIVGLARSASQGIVVVRAVASYLTVNTLSRRSTCRSSGRARLPISQHPGVEPRCGEETHPEAAGAYAAVARSHRPAELPVPRS